MLHSITTYCIPSQHIAFHHIILMSITTCCIPSQHIAFHHNMLHSIITSCIPSQHVAFHHYITPPSHTNLHPKGLPPNESTSIDAPGLSSPSVGMTAERGDDGSRGLGDKEACPTLPCAGCSCPDPSTRELPCPSTRATPHRDSKSRALHMPHPTSRARFIARDTSQQTQGTRQVAQGTRQVAVAQVAQGTRQLATRDSLHKAHDRLHKARDSLHAAHDSLHQIDGSRVETHRVATD